MLVSRKQIVVACVLVIGCALELPALPNGASVGDAGSSSSGASDATDESSGPPHSSGNELDTSTGVVGDTGSTGGGLDTSPTATDEGVPPVSESSGDDDESTGVGVESTGAEEPWFAGHYEGAWDGDCPPPIPLAGNGTWSVDISGEGEIDGSYEGDFSGTIAGWLDRAGNATATATGPELGECDWDGIIAADGDAQGELHCSFECEGDWAGAKS